jgi:hypothetical protein
MMTDFSPSLDVEVMMIFKKNDTWRSHTGPSEVDVTRAQEIPLAVLGSGGSRSAPELGSARAKHCKKCTRPCSFCAKALAPRTAGRRRERKKKKNVRRRARRESSGHSNRDAWPFRRRKKEVTPKWMVRKDIENVVALDKLHTRNAAMKLSPLLCSEAA